MPKYCLTDAYLNYFPNAHISYPNICDCVITIFHMKFLGYVYVYEIKMFCLSFFAPETLHVVLTY